MRGKTAVVTGPASGIGRATVLRPAAEGARMACVDRAGAGAEAAARAIAAAGGEAFARQADVTAEGACAPVVEATRARVGRVDEVAAAILSMASDEASFVTGVALPVGGGDTAG